LELHDAESGRPLGDGEALESWLAQLRQEAQADYDQQEHIALQEVTNALTEEQTVWDTTGNTLRQVGPPVLMLMRSPQ
jgi:hypothetical protein